MFSVYGKSVFVAKKIVDKIILNKNSDLSTELRKAVCRSQTEQQEIVDKYVKKVFESMKPKRCTHEFSTPEIADQAFEIMKGDKSNFSDLLIMKKVPKLNAEAFTVISKSSGKPLMKWIPLYEDHQEAAKAA
jgi:hypothetical protein